MPIRKRITQPLPKRDERMLGEIRIFMNLYKQKPRSEHRRDVAWSRWVKFCNTEQLDPRITFAANVHLACEYHSLGKYS